MITPFICCRQGLFSVQFGCTPGQFVYPWYLWGVNRVKFSPLEVGVFVSSQLAIPCPIDRGLFQKITSFITGFWAHLVGGGFEHVFFSNFRAKREKWSILTTLGTNIPHGTFESMIFVENPQLGYVSCGGTYFSNGWLNHLVDYIFVPWEWLNLLILHHLEKTSCLIRQDMVVS